MGTGFVDCVELSVVQRNLFIFLAMLYFSAKLFVLKLCMSFYVYVTISEKGQNLGTTSLKFCAGKPMVLNDQFIWHLAVDGNLATV
jgi:hypothetical protein